MIVREDISLPNHSRISKAERGVLSMLRIAVGFFFVQCYARLVFVT